MPSSTSSSDRLGRFGAGGDSARLWLLALSIALSITLGLEIAARRAGFQPSVKDDPRTWVAARARIEGDCAVFAGTSRIQAAIDPETWAERWQGELPIQLAIAGDTPLPVLEELAADASFRGTLIFEVLPRVLLDAREERGRETERYLAEWHRGRSGPSRRLETRLRVLLAEHLASRSLPPGQLLRRLLAPGPKRVPYFSMRADRFLRLDFSRADLERRRSTIVSQIDASRAPDEERDREDVLTRLLAAEARLHARGARLVWLHMPRSGEIEAIEEERFPRARFWDVLTARSRAPALHAQETAGLDGFDCPDGSHIDVRDAPAFTRALAELLRTRLQRS